MRKVSVILAGILFLTNLVMVSGEPKDAMYKIADIPIVLLRDAKAVVRKNDIEFSISGEGKALRRVTYAVTILNDNGIENSVFYSVYNKFSSVRKVDIKIFDSEGEAIRNIPGLITRDYSAISGYSVYEDYRVKFLDPDFRTIPFTVEYSYETLYDGILDYPDWIIYPDFNISVESSSFTVLVPEGINLRYNEQRMPVTNSVKNTNNGKEYSWVIKNLPALSREPYSPDFTKLSPVVYLAPEKFTIDGTHGDCSSWQAFGNWIKVLNEGRDLLGEETNNLIQSKTRGLSDTEKVVVLYEYLQSKVRYASIQIGIGGWQTIDARDVDRLGYGDCKALANYMKSILNTAGIKSYYTLVRAGDNAPEIVNDFPSNQFNHAFLCVPLNGDTIWLECTSQQIPAGYIGKFADDREALLITENGGKLVRTPVYGADENVQSRTGIVKISSEGNFNASLKSVYSGIYYDDNFSALNKSDEDRRKIVYDKFSLPSFKLNSVTFKESRHRIPAITEEVMIELPRYCTFIGNRLIFNPDIFTRFRNPQALTAERKAPIEIRRSTVESDTLRFIIPENCSIELIPEPRHLVSRFGEYRAEVFVRDNEIFYIRSLKFNKGVFSTGLYREFTEFCRNISSADENRLSLLRN